MIGFLEEAPGVKSSTRVVTFLLMACVAAVVTFIGIYTLGRPTPDATVVASLAGVVTALVAQGIVAIINRTRYGGDRCVPGDKP